MHPPFSVALPSAAVSPRRHGVLGHAPGADHADVVVHQMARAGGVAHLDQPGKLGVHVEHDGTGGLAAARKLRPVACVLDIALPGMDGTEICRRLREAGDWTPVLFLTARDDEVDRILGLELGKAAK